jgi:hypothetical protein
MELPELIESKRQELEHITDTLSVLEGELEGACADFPPRWNKDVTELDKFIQELSEWIKDPKVKRAKEIIGTLKKPASDKRSFQGLDKDYLIGVLDALEDAVKILSSISDDLLKANVSKKVLDGLQEEQDITELVREAEDYCISFKDVEQIDTTNDFTKCVKDQELKLLAQSAEFSLENIQNAKNNLAKATSAFELLNGSGVNAQAYIKTYEILKSVDTVWQEANEIRRCLGKTLFKIVGNLSEPFGEMTNILKQRKKSLNKGTLEEIISGLTQVEERINQWKNKVEKRCNEEYQKTKELIEFSEMKVDVDGLYESFGAIFFDFSDVNLLYTPYKEFREIQRKAISKLEKQFSESERKIIENIDRADDLAESMGEDFWSALKSLRVKQLIRIAIRRGTN